MASATTPLGMRTMPASGYNHNSTTYNKQYITWKGTGINSNPIGSAPGHIRPLTNNDVGNVFQTGFGLPRPIKHYRKGRVIVNEKGNSGEAAQINYNMNRFVKSNKGTSLGGGGGGSGLLNDMQDKPGAFLVKQNPVEVPLLDLTQLDSNCKTCEGIGVVANYYPNNTFLTENPETTTTNKVLCCNPEYKAKRRAIYASTNLKKNYYTTTKQYLQNRCKTYDQKTFNFASNDMINNGAKPGSPAALTNTYLANCNSNAQVTGNCQLTVYKPNNHQYAKQGAVDSSTRNLKLNVDTISTNAASIQNYNNTGAQLISANEINTGNNPNVMNLLKNKAPHCNTTLPLNFRPTFQNKRHCVGTQ